ncbi:MAG: DUF1501 domain-containing protein [Gemmataceae bacterium]
MNYLPFPMCHGPNRRDFLRMGLLGLGGLSLGSMVQASALGHDTKPYARHKSVVFLFLAGGPSQHETFDPKPDAPEGTRCIAGHIPTKIAGVRFASYLPKLANLADRLTVVRSFQTNHAEHNGAHKQLLTADLTVQDGKPITEPGLGAVYARAVGAVHPRTGLPRHALIPPTTRNQAGRAGFNGAFESVVEGSQPAGLGMSFAPLELYAPLSDGYVEQKQKSRNQPAEQPNPFLDLLEPRLSAAELNNRLELLRQLDRLDRQLDVTGTLDKFDQFSRQAADMLQRGDVRKALDLSLEDKATLQAYDTEHFRNWNCDANSKFIRNGPSVGFSLGRQLLLARRLCEAGCGFVTVINANWDFHARKEIPNIPEGMSVFGPPLDHAVSAFLEDIRQRGLEDQILLVITGEFGRTPGIDKNLGRHHWPRLCPLVFAGGGLRHGQVIGDSDRRGGEPASQPITIADLHATILHTLFDVGQMRLDASLPEIVHDRAQRGTPIRELFA